jgi:hypothetical protein
LSNQGSLDAKLAKKRLSKIGLKKIAPLIYYGFDSKTLNCSAAGARPIGEGKSLNATGSAQSSS